MNTIETTVSPETAVQALEGIVSQYTLNSIRSQIFQKAHEEEKKNFEEKYCWSYWSTHNEKTFIHTSKSFEDRAMAMKWINEERLGEPKFSKMSYATSEGLPKTLCTLKCVGEFEGIPFEIEANYTRDGLPTKKCRVVSSINYSVACEV